jgi:hypothetical protein
MRKAKLMLLAISILAIAGGAMAFKAKNPSRTFYSYGEIILHGVFATGCVVPVNLTYIPTTTTLGTITIPYSTIALITQIPSACVTTVLTANYN